MLAAFFPAWAERRTGGLLSAHALSGRKIFLTKAQDCDAVVSAEFCDANIYIIYIYITYIYITYIYIVIMSNL